MIFIGCNVLTAEAKESDDKKVCEDYNGEWKNIGGGVRGCTFENDDDAERYGFRAGFSLDSTGGDAEYGIEDLVTYDDEGNKIYPNTETDSSKQQQEEEKAAQEADNNKEKTKELCLENDGDYDGKCEFKDNEGTAEQDQVDFEHSLADRGLWEEYDKNYNGADWEYDEADA
jgi:hypothetical protein